jgi:hypothetical protein
MQTPGFIIDSSRISSNYLSATLIVLNSNIKKRDKVGKAAEGEN